MNNYNPNLLKFNISKFLKTGAILFCLMCLFFATHMASKYEHQKTETEIQCNKVKELEERVHELTNANLELSRIRHALVQEKEQLCKEINTLQDKHVGMEDWKIATKDEKEALNNERDNKQ